MPEAKEDLAKLETWAHRNPYILKGGRTSYYVPKHLSEDDANVLKSSLEESDPQVDRLKAITEDKRKDE